METQAEDTVRRKMESLRLIYDGEIPIQQQKMDSLTTSFRKSLELIGATARETFQNHGKIGEVKAKLRLAEDDMVKALAVKTRKEAERMARMDAIAAQKARVEELRRSVQEQRANRDEYAAITSQQFLALAALEDRSNKEVECKAETQVATLWYNRVLGFHVEGGHVLDCDPHLNDTKELIHELNRTNGLFKFVRIMREKFQEAVAQEFWPQSTTRHQESSMISMSAPVLSMSTDRSESSDHCVQHGEGNRPKKVIHARVMKPDVLSPGSASSVRWSPRLKVNK
ncbi:kinetochore protein SPC25 homolog isoform X2 [Carya illinoinensis]|uniref:kinetochore protein SPC25 homolog isoform X2 n=1 Tax=Carya illinoinensis TaxID=32201 RepID=UPI001C71CA80|nr:kinetochore protein SPC25 homolog isoform X2 [Carya illinoinensis]